MTTPDDLAARERAAAAIRGVIEQLVKDTGLTANWAAVKGGVSKETGRSLARGIDVRGLPPNPETSTLWRMAVGFATDRYSREPDLVKAQAFYERFTAALSQAHAAPPGEQTDLDRAKSFVNGLLAKPIPSADDLAAVHALLASYGITLTTEQWPGFSAHATPGDRRRALESARAMLDMVEDAPLPDNDPVTAPEQPETRRYQNGAHASETGR